MSITRFSFVSWWSFKTDPPSSAKIYWGEDKEDYTEEGKKANLTCESSSSYPPSTFRWFKGNTEYTNDAVYVKEENANGSYFIEDALEITR